MNRGFLVILSGPAAIGKSAIASMVLADRSLDLHRSISYTTRHPREFEADGRNFFFISKHDFEDMAARGQFLETSEFEGEKFGTRSTWLERKLDEGTNILATLDVPGASSMISLFDGPRTMSFYIRPTSEAEMRRKLALDGIEDIEERIQLAREQAPLASRFDFIIENSNIQLTADQIRTLIHHAQTCGLKDPSVSKGTVFRAGSFLVS